MGYKALLIGATGLTGSHCLNLLLGQQRYDEVAVVTRRPINKTHPKLVQHVIDFANIKRHRNLLEADHVYSCLGTTIASAGSEEAFKNIDFGLTVYIAKSAYELGATRFTHVSSIGANPESRFFYLKVKGETEQALRQIGYDSLLIMRPAGLLGKRREFRLKEKLGNLGTKLLSPVMAGPLKNYRPIKAEAVAFVMCHLPEENLNGTHIYESRIIQELYNHFQGKKD